MPRAEYITGQVVGNNNIVFLNETDTPCKKNNYIARGMFLCHCGNEFTTQIRSIRSGHTTSCGCFHRKKLTEKDYVYAKGDKIGNFIYLGEAPKIGKKRMITAQCACGKIMDIRLVTDPDKGTKSCGCLTEYKKGDEFKNAPLLNINEHIINKFWSKVLITANDNLCWNWISTKDGYGTLYVKQDDGKQKSYKATRISYLINNNVDPGELDVAHFCDNPKCVNPKHLFLATHQENMNDRENKGRGARLNGENHGSSKLTEKQVLEIRELGERGSTHISIAEKYNVNRSTIGLIIRRKNWNHII